MTIQRALHLGFCFGVRDALALARQRLALGPVTLLGDLVHNETVAADLRRRGARTEPAPERVTTPAVMITAHGASDRRRADLAARGFAVLDATCPLVRRAHEALAALVAQGLHPVVVGQRGHVEVRGLTEDHPAADVILTEADVDALVARPGYGVVAQTTQPVARVRTLVNRLRDRLPQARVVWTDTVCRPTKERQAAAEDLARGSDAVVVIGGANSNNTHQLVATCRRFCARVHHVQTAADVARDWFRPADRVGLTAGTSTPDEVIAAVEARLWSFAAAFRRTRQPEPLAA
jgi:4-hydroxy-3-methylbut-2-en-1-yl diphosphate reductase